MLPPKQLQNNIIMETEIRQQQERGIDQIIAKQPQNRQSNNVQQSPNSSFTANSACNTFSHSHQDSHTLQQKQFKNLFQKFSNQDCENYQKKCQFDQIKRLIVLKFILSFGCNFQNTEKMYVKLVAFSKGQFKDVPQQFRLFQNTFLDSLQQINQQYINLFYFSYQRYEVFKRITKIYSLKKLQKMYQSKPDKFPFNQVFQVILQNKNQAVKFPFWKAQQDFIMLSLILQKGFGRWESILSSTDWEKYKGQYKNGEKRYVSNKKYRQHLQIILFDGKKVIPVGLVDILEERSAYFLRLVK